MLPELLRIPAFGPLHSPFALHTYGVLIAIGFVLATAMIAREARRLGESDPDRFTDLAFYLLLAGLVGSRVTFIAVNWKLYVEHPLEILSFWRGGLVFYGGFFAALAYAYVWARRHHMAFFKLADLYVPFVAFNHAWGRLGCLAAGCCYGKPTTVAWGLSFPRESAVQATQHAQGLIGLLERPLPVHPTQLYEATGELLLFLVLVAYRSRKRFHGQLLLIWLIGYAALRATVEGFRGDLERGFVGPLSTSQALSACTILFALGLIYYFRKRAQTAALL